MPQFTPGELSEARRAIASALGKSEKALMKLKDGMPQYGITIRGIEAYRISISLIDKCGVHYSAEELGRAEKRLAETVLRVEKVMSKFAPGTSQHTLAVRRIAAFNIAAELIRSELKGG